MSTAAPDHFSRVAAHYAKARPDYPSALFDWLATRCHERQLAVDVGAGTGQATLELARRFEHVVGTDLSAQQVANAARAPNIEYRVAAAERTGVETGAADLVVVAQALHWFDLALFWPEVHRILKPGGVVAVWTYGILQVEGEQVDACVQDFYTNVVGRYWPKGREHVEDGYAQLSFPFAALPVPRFEMECLWTLEAFLGYVRSWSSTGRMAEATGTDPVESLAARLAPLWGPPQRARAVRWPLRLRVGRGG